jgi:hypothetical protein
MQSTIFSTASDSFPISHVIHAGPVTAYPQEKRKSDHTHYFRLTTVHGPAFCHFKNEEAARRARGLLGAMLGTMKPHLFRSKGDCIDVASIVSFGRPVKLKSDGEEERYGLPVNIAATSDKNKTIWLTFQTEDSAKNVRRALFASVMAHYSQPEKTITLPTVGPEDSLTCKDNFTHPIAA